MNEPISDVELDHTIRRIDYEVGVMVEYHCPGCGGWHHVYVTGDETKHPVWGFNGDFVRPTFTPSVLVTGGTRTRVCHVFITDGEISFLQDCTHALAGQKVPMVPRRDWPKKASLV